MTNKLELYKCEICGNLVEILVSGDGELVCCGQPMHHLQPKNKESEGLEKHVPIFVKNDCGNTEIRVGSIPHPMENEHFIMFIQTISADNNKVTTTFLHPNDIPKMRLECLTDALIAREYCNIHGLWENYND